MGEKKPLRKMSLSKGFIYLEFYFTISLHKLSNMAILFYIFYSFSFSSEILQLQQHNTVQISFTWEPIIKCKGRLK